MGIFDVFSNAPAQNAANAQIAGINSGYGQLSGLAGQGRGALQTNYAAGLQPFQQNYAGSQQGTTALGNALGLNGPGGSAAALAAFNANPATQNMIDLASENVKRNQAATGQLASGATNVDLAKVAPELFQQQWNNYVGQLEPYLNYSQGAAGGIGSLYSGLGNQLNQSYGNQGNAAYGAATSAGNANANAALNNYNVSANTLGAITGAAKALFGAIP